jgi:hypothetical protein
MAKKDAPQKKTATSKKAATTKKKSTAKAAVKAEAKVEEKKSIEEIQDENLDQFKKDVAKIDSVEELVELEKVEQRDDHRKGAFEIIEDRKEELGAESPTDSERVDTKQLVKDLRLALDKATQCCDGHMRIGEEPKRSLFLAKAWLGVILGEFGIEDSRDNADSMDHKMQVRHFGLQNVSDAIESLREELSEIAEDVYRLDVEEHSKVEVCKRESWKNVLEARFHLGVTLANMNS